MTRMGMGMGMAWATRRAYTRAIPFTTPCVCMQHVHGDSIQEVCECAWGMQPVGKDIHLHTRHPWLQMLDVY